SSRHVTMGSSYAAGKWSLTFGWGVQFVDFHADAATAYPYRSDVLLERGTKNGSSALLAVGGAIVYKTFRIGASAKYAGDDVAALTGGAPAVHAHALLADLGVARTLF